MTESTCFNFHFLQSEPEKFDLHSKNKTSILAVFCKLFSINLFLSFLFNSKLKCSCYHINPVLRCIAIQEGDRKHMPITMISERIVFISMTQFVNHEKQNETFLVTQNICEIARYRLQSSGVFIQLKTQRKNEKCFWRGFKRRRRTTF